jgi:hypothetical protein
MSQNLPSFRLTAGRFKAVSIGKDLETDNGCPVPSVNSAVSVDSAECRQILAGVTAWDRTHIVARFWTKVHKTDTCWLWTAATFKGGYGQFVFRERDKTPQRHIYAHRLSWELANGLPIPVGLVICHQCDRPGCVNPDHLFVGTQAENLDDAREKGRLDESLPRTKKLTPEERLEIFNAPNYPGLGRDLAKRYGVSAACISKIRSGRFARSRGASASPSREVSV